jgi:hypothetical protein
MKCTQLFIDKNQANFVQSNRSLRIFSGERPFLVPLKKTLVIRLFKNVQMQGVQDLSREAYIDVRRMAKGAAQRRRWAVFNSL